MLGTQKLLAVITGGSGYIGGAIVREFEKRGWQTANLSRGSKEYPCDITDEKNTVVAVKKIVEALGNISACIHAAHPNESNGLDSLKSSLAVAESGANHLARAAESHMAANGAFIGITTQLIEEGLRSPQGGAYIESKKALRAFLRDLAREWSSKGLRVYAVAPGYLPGGLNKDVPKAVIEMLAKKTSKTHQTVEGVAKLVVRIADGKAFPSGTSILVDGEVVSPL